MPELTLPTDDILRDEASQSGRAALEASLEKFTPDVRDAFWNAIGLYYSSRRHPGADEPKTDASPPAVAA
ncbi:MULTISPECIES: hypothetical protein [Methylobacterium]|uniref:Uncharacterized protein n=1 Tax=Methylobacterium thuringiense TaxID=1003091 RepID=A0ABQ4TRN7_9HYPH|nr:MULTISPECIES: hypothetical protein [Methylobacterium]TXN21979.1 hypothetical protein FV217_12570 [Methylobacterium sp. WL9]GJE56827.1 hypothetical protein EKPJFOCH_3335 [Methylobacterium thuringiense]